METSEPDARLKEIELTKVSAEELLQRAQHETMKRHVRSAVRNLDEALIWLDIVKDSAIADLEIQAALTKLDRVERSLEKFGPDAQEIG